MREIEFRGKGKFDNEWYYGDLIIVNDTDKSRHYYIITNEYSDADVNIANTIKLETCNSPEVDKDTIGQYIGTNKFCRIYENMKLYDMNTEEDCIIEFDETDCNYIINYINVGIAEKLENLDGLVEREE